MQARALPLAPGNVQGRARRGSWRRRALPHPPGRVPGWPGRGKPAPLILAGNSLPPTHTRSDQSSDCYAGVGGSIR